MTAWHRIDGPNPPPRDGLDADPYIQALDDMDERLRALSLVKPPLAISKAALWDMTVEISRLRWGRVVRGRLPRGRQPLSPA